MSESTETHPGRKRGIAPMLLLFFVAGDMIGGGIHALTGKAGAAVGGAIRPAFRATDAILLSR